jgi:hypothetical protein
MRSRRMPRTVAAWQKQWLQQQRSRLHCQLVAWLLLLPAWALDLRKWRVGPEAGAGETGGPHRCLCSERAPTSTLAQEEPLCLAWKPRLQPSLRQKAEVKTAKKTRTETGIAIERNTRAEAVLEAATEGDGIDRPADGGTDHQVQEDDRHRVTVDDHPSRISGSHQVAA